MKTKASNYKPAPSLRVVSYTLPAYWASYLINGDASGIDEADKAKCDEWHKTRDLPFPVSCGDKGRDEASGETGEPWFARSNDASDLAGDVWDFTYLLPAKGGEA